MRLFHDIGIFTDAPVQYISKDLDISACLPLPGGSDSAVHRAFNVMSQTFFHMISRLHKINI